MIEATMNSTFLIALHVILQLAFMVRAVLRPRSDPTSRLAWVVVIAILPVLGILAYLLVGEVNIGQRRAARLQERPRLLPPAGNDAALLTLVPERHRHLFHAARSINGLWPVGGNHARLLTDSRHTLDAMVADIDNASDHVHVLFYIWLADRNGCRMIDALKRAAARGVTCRAMADDLGSRDLIRSPHWQAMQAAGVRVATALPIGNPFLRMFFARIDVRNHSKIVVIDNRITYCGSQNCADAEFRPKPRYAPWVDAVIRLQGPVARQNQYLFARDWMDAVDEDLTPLLASPAGTTDAQASGHPAQVIGTGPSVRHSAMPEVFESLMFAARRELVITTPYYVPNDSMQNALCAAAYRGVATTLILPARNDSWVVRAASRSYYASLLAAGVAIREYEGGLLHVKSITMDGEITLMGSANLDRRSFELNIENNVLLYDPELTASLRQCQQGYIDQSRQVTPEQVQAWSVARRLWNNAIAMLGPLL